MNKIQILDCTLRDGGYINNWEFGDKNIIKVIKSLVNSNIEIVECGFLSNPEEEKKLLNDEYQNKLAWGIYTGIIDYFNN